MGSLSITHLLILAVIVALIFGTSRLRNVGKDLGGAIKGFKEGMRDEENAAPPKQVDNQQGGHTIEGEVKDKTQSKG